MLQRKRPLVSVIVPVYNGERYLAQALDSVLNQTYRPLEVVVVDASSTDSSAAIASRCGPPVRCVTRPHHGLATGRNIGADLASGEFLSFLDADDLWVASKLEWQVACYDHDPGLDLVFGHAQEFISPDVPAERAAQLHHQRGPAPARSCSTMLVRRSAFARVGPYDSRWRVGESIEWQSRAEEMGLKEQVLPQVLLLRRIHGGNMSLRRREDWLDYVRIARQALHRRCAGDSADTEGRDEGQVASKEVG